MTSAQDASDALARVAAPSGGGYEVARLTADSSFRVGRGPEGAVVLLTPPEVEERVGVPTRLRRLTVHARAAVSVETPGAGSSTETVGLVELRELSEDLIPAFCGVAAAVADLIGEDPAPGVVRAALRHVVRLFEPRPGRRGSVLGLWGELLTILISTSPEVMVEAWHVEVDDRFDFAVPGTRLEVKTTDGGRRAHEFNLEQLRPIDGAEARLVSIVTTSTSAGSSLSELVGSIQERLPGRVDLVMKVWQLVAETLGDDWMPSTASLRWDRVQAEESLRLFQMDEVPRIREQLDPAIESVRLRVVCEGVRPLDGPVGIPFQAVPKE